MKSSRRSSRSRKLSDEFEIIRRGQYLLEKYSIGDDFQPMKITFDMAAPMAMGHPWLHFDGLLAHFVFRDAFGSDYWLLPSKLPVPLQIPLPLEDTDGLWHASVSVFDADEEDWTTTTVYKRFDSRHADMMDRGRKRYIRINSGRYRLFMMSLPYLPVKTVRFFANGDIEHVRRLLSHVQYLGKKAAYGFGAVKSVRVEPTDEDISVVDEDGNAMRPIPIDLLESYEDQVRLAWKPPFWDKNNVTLCAPPGTKVSF